MGEGDVVATVTETVVVRPGRTKALPEIARLWRELVGFHEALGGQDFRLAPGAEARWRTYLQGHIGRRSKLCLVALAGPQPVGFLLGSVQARAGIFMEREVGEISDVYVQAPFRRKGVGKALVDAALEWFEVRRVGRVRIRTDARNTMGVEFWKTLGFQTAVLTMDRLT